MGRVRGRPKIDDPRSRNLVIRLRESEYSGLCRISEQTGNSISELVRKSIAHQYCKETRENFERVL